MWLLFDKIIDWLCNENQIMLELTKIVRHAHPA